jgi:hypothetical protein
LLNYSGKKKIFDNKNPVLRIQSVFNENLK